MAQALQGECMDVWGVSIGKLSGLLVEFIFVYVFTADMLLFDEKNYNVMSMPKNLKVCSTR
jgi:hypothetical protein